MRRTLITLGLLAVVTVATLTWSRAREFAALEKLTAEINAAAADIDKAVTAEVPADPKVLTRHLERLGEFIKYTDELTPRMGDMAPKANGDAGDRFREAISNYSKKSELIGPRLNEIQKRIDELKAKQK